MPGTNCAPSQLTAPLSSALAWRSHRPLQPRRGHGGCSTSRHSSGSPRRRRGGHGVLYPLLHALMPSPSPGARITSPPNSYILSRCSCTASRLKPWGRFWTSSSSHAHCASANNCTQQMPFSHCVEAWHRTLGFRRQCGRMAFQSSASRQQARSHSLGASRLCWGLSQLLARSLRKEKPNPNAAVVLQRWQVLRHREEQQKTSMMHLKKRG
mmetsp:Transcript_9544/g.28706  ORF Transcript_9544/g.28706 Transcript_9544/m.28706 type:complete len:211 (+) Transcript_9544:1554-2186(+)